MVGKVEDLKMSNAEDDSVDEVGDVSVQKSCDRTRLILM